MRDVVTIAKALSDESRVRILAMLDGRELCVCQVIELLDLAPSTVSKHLAILKQARLVEGRKDGRWMYYRLADEEAPPAATQAIRWALQALRGDKRLRGDAQRRHRGADALDQPLLRRERAVDLSPLRRRQDDVRAIGDRVIVRALIDDELELSERAERRLVERDLVTEDPQGGERTAL